MADKATPAKPHRQRSIASQAKRGCVNPIKNKGGRPTGYSEKTADIIIKRLSNGETLSSITESMGITQKCVYDWCKRYPEFSRRYNESKQDQVTSLLNKLLDEVSVVQNDQALAARVKSDLIKWYASKIAPQQFGDSKRIELSGEIQHKHVHALEDHQKRKIAEAWLISQQTDDSPGITAETTGPDLLETGVQVVDDDEKRVIPKKKKPALPGKIKKSDPDSDGHWVGKREIVD